MEVVDSDPHVRQRRADAGYVGRRRVDHHHLHRGPEGRGLLSEPALHTATGTAWCQAEQQPTAGWVGVDERGEPRVRPAPARRRLEPAHAAGPGLINTQHRCRSRLGQPPRGSRDQRPVGGAPVHVMLTRHVRHRPIRPGDASAICSRRRVVSRARCGIAVARSTNERRRQAVGRHTSRRLRHHSSTRCPDAGRSLTRHNGRSFTRDDSTPHSGQTPSPARVSITTRTAPSPTLVTSTTANSSSPNSSVVPSSMLVASSADVL